MRRIHDTNLVFVHIPKNAGQAVTNCFNCSHRPTDHSLNSAEDKEFMDSKYIRFAVVRNPIDRFISAYKYQCHMSHVNTGKVPLRKFIVQNNLDDNINKFINCISSTKYDLQTDMWFRRQVFWIRASKPQIIIRFENIQQDINIVKYIAPQYFKGLKKVNISKGRERSDKAQSQVDQKSMEFIKKFYERDFFYLSYDPNL